MKPKLVSELSATCTTGRCREDDLIDFMIDGVSLRESLLRQEGARGRLKPNSSLPHFNGLLRRVLAHYIDVFRTGYSNRRIAAHSSLAPVITCECGEPSCGGVWTNVFVGGKYVNWSGLRFWNTGPELPGPTYDGSIQVFDRIQYEETLTSLVGKIERLENESAEQAGDAKRD